MLRPGHRGRHAAPGHAGRHEPGVRLARRPADRRPVERRRAPPLSGRGRRGASRSPARSRTTRSSGGARTAARSSSSRLGGARPHRSGSSSRAGSGRPCGRSGPTDLTGVLQIGHVRPQRRPEELRVRLPAHVLASLSRGGGAMTLTTGTRLGPYEILSPLGRRRNGRGLQGEGHPRRADGRAEGPARGVLREQGEHRALRARGAPAREPEPSEHRPSLLVRGDARVPPTPRRGTCSSWSWPRDRRSRSGC